MAVVPRRLSQLRLILNPVLWLLAILGLRLSFVAVLLLAGATDALDGFIARRTGTASDRGARLDSLADNLLGLSSLGWMWIFLHGFLRGHWPIIGVAVGLNVLSFVVGYLRYGRGVAYHLATDKLSGVVYFSFMALALAFEPTPWLFYATLGINILSSIEEIAASVRYPRMRSDILTVFQPELDQLRRRGA